ncbi:Auxin-induced protein 5NG4 [Hordeum vulgare]|nr:Auxin-induced protein 5NG4 [Hordeum vulgare]
MPLFAFIFSNRLYNHNLSSSPLSTETTDPVLAPPLAPPVHVPLFSSHQDVVRRSHLQPDAHLAGEALPGRRDRGGHPPRLGHIEVEGPVELTRNFLNLGYAHPNLPPGTRPMFHLNVNPADGGIPLAMLTVTFRNGLDAHALLGRVFWCGSEFIAFTAYNIFTNYGNIFPAHNQMHSLPYNFDEQ